MMEVPFVLDEAHLVFHAAPLPELRLPSTVSPRLRCLVFPLVLEAVASGAEECIDMIRRDGCLPYFELLGRRLQ